MDMTTQNKVFSRICGPQGILRRRNSTVILATHATRFLRYMDKVVVIGDQGSIVEPGSLSIISAGDYASSGDDDMDEDSIDPPEHYEDIESNRHRYSNTRPAEQEDPILDKARQTGDFAVYRYYFSCLSWKMGLTFLFFQLCYAFTTTFPTVWLKW